MTEEEFNTIWDEVYNKGFDDGDEDLMAYDEAQFKFEIRAGWLPLRFSGFFKAYEMGYEDGVEHIWDD